MGHDLENSIWDETVTVIESIVTNDSEGNELLRIKGESMWSSVYFDYPVKKEGIGHEKKASHHHSSILTIRFLTASFSVHMTCEIYCKLEWPSVLLFGSSFMVTWTLHWWWLEVGVSWWRLYWWCACVYGVLKSSQFQAWSGFVLLQPYWCNSHEVHLFLCNSGSAVVLVVLFPILLSNEEKGIYMQGSPCNHSWSCWSRVVSQRRPSVSPPNRIRQLGHNSGVAIHNAG